MTSKTSLRLQYLIDNIPAKLMAISENDFCAKPAPNKWSKKEILGHLIDSATNNHQRFIRTQFENVPHIVYDQNNWNSFSHYNELGSKHIVHFWAMYNKHLLEIIKRIPEANLTKECHTGGDNNVTLAWLIDDYVVHMEHHLKQITKL